MLIISTVAGFLVGSYVMMLLPEALFGFAETE